MNPPEGIALHPMEQQTTTKHTQMLSSYYSSVYQNQLKLAKEHPLKTLEK